MKLMASDIAAVLKELKVNRTHFIGYSMGGWIGFGIAKCYPQHFHSLVIGGMHPYARMDQSWIKNLTLYRNAFSSDSVDTTKKLALIEEWLGPTAAKMPECKEYAQRVLATNDWEALIALASKDWGHGFDDVLPTMTMPVLLFVGETDSFYPGVKECAKSIPNATYISFPGIDHAELEFRKDLVLPYITDFLKKVIQP
jgi:pimeloyl-ACP methyl ester carboxylesterase